MNKFGAMESAEVVTLTTCFAVLVDAIAIEPLRYADKLLSCLLVSRNDYDRVLNLGSNADKARSLISCVRRKIQTNPEEEFLKFMDVIQHDEQLARKIWNIYAEEKRTNYKKAFDDIMKSENQVIKMLFAKIIFLGPPGRGKTLTRLRLEETMVNMESNPEYKNNPSTQVAKGETYLLTDLLQTAAVASESGWKSLKEESEEVKIVFQLLYKVLHEAGESFTTKSDSAEIDYTPQKRIKSSTEEKTKSSFELSTRHLVEMLDKSMTSHSWDELSSSLENLCLLYMKDTGGQPELMDLLPALIIGPALYLLFCKLGEDLDKTYNVCLRGVSNTIPDRMSSCTVRENLMSALSSIFSMHSYSARSTPVAEGELFHQVVQDTPNAVAYIVGTHKDEVSADEIVAFDEKMQIIEDTIFYEEDLVHFVSKDGFKPGDPKDIMPEGQDRLIYPIDNYFGTNMEIKDFQKFILKALNTFPRTEIPARWLPFSLLLRSAKKRCINLDMCYDSGKQLGMDKRETDIALWFFHHRLGIIMHFPDVPELKDHVITDTQFIFDSFSNLIFENGVSMSKCAGNNFRKVGQISFDDIKKISGDVFPPKQMEALLKHLNVIAPLDKPLFAGKSSYRMHHQLYFMPCVLENSSSDRLKEFVKSTMSEAANTYSIKLCYQCGFSPIGLFPALIAKLVSQKEMYGFKLLNKEEVKKNLIKFTYGKDKDKVIFISTAKYYQIIIIERVGCKALNSSHVCVEVRKKIECTLEAMSDESGSLLHKMESICGRYQWAFDCPVHPEEDHLSVVEIGEESPHIMECQMSREGIDMEERHCVWFGPPHSDLTPNIVLPHKKLSKIASTEHGNVLAYQHYVEIMADDKKFKLQCEINSDQDICKLAEKMIGWESKYFLFSLTPHKVHDIQHGANKDRSELQRIEVLHTWKNECPHPTYDCLLKAFIEGGFSDCATEIVEIINRD